MAEYKTVSVVIPTLNRRRQLLRSLGYYKRQTLPADMFEIIIVDDGSRIPASDYIDMKNYKSTIRIFRQKNSGPARARNVGLKKAGGDVILFTGDDIEPAADFLEKHLKAHNRYPENNVAILGYVEWPPEMECGIYYATKLNRIFSYADIKNNRNVSYKHFYTSNISLKRKYLADTGERFCEKFSKAAFEDTEFGYRLKKRCRLKIIFFEDIVGYHNHKMTLSSLYNRHFEDGQMAVVFHMLHPEIFGDKISYAKWRPAPIRKNIPAEFIELDSKLAEAQDTPGIPLYFRHIFSETRYHYLSRILDFAHHSGLEYGLKSNRLLNRNRRHDAP